LQGKICDMRILLKYAKNAAIAYSHKTDMPIARADTSYNPVSVSVCHKSVFCRNGWTEQSVVLPVILTLIDLVLLGLIVLLLYVCILLFML